MADEQAVAVDWPVEEIADPDRLYLRVHQNQVDWKTGRVLPAAFKKHGDGMSTDWSKYSTPEDSRNRARVPEKNGVLSFVVGEVRGLDGHAVVHKPIPSNRSHTDVEGPDDNEARVLRRRLASTEIEILRPGV